MDIYRIKAQQIHNGVVIHGQFFELVTGLTATNWIAFGKWFGTVSNGSEENPFILDQDGNCQYAGDRTQLRHCSIATKPVELGVFFELTWENAQDRYGYKIVEIGRLNT